MSFEYAILIQNQLGNRHQQEVSPFAGKTTESDGLLLLIQDLSSPSGWESAFADVNHRSD
jgi:hypothetical protein